MTPDEIIKEIWQLSWYQVLKVAVMDDIILLVKIWPVWVVIIVVLIGAAHWNVRQSDNGR